jgi:hypothetical protein
MSYIGIASKAGTLSSGIEALIRDGRCSIGLASKLGCLSSGVESFIEGRSCPIPLAKHCGSLTSNMMALRAEIGREGAIGLILGLALGLPSEK